MAKAPAERKYDLIVFGATGYTGRLTCEEVLANTPSSLRWAIAGRSPNKLELLAVEYNRRFQDRVPVVLITGIFIADVQEEDAMEKLARATCCLISTVGPFLRYGQPVLEACSLNGTHYVDSTPETPWVREMILKYHKTAQTNGAIIIPQCGVQSAPADLAAYSLVKIIHERLNCPTDNVVLSLEEMKTGTSGGTVETLMSVWENVTLQEMIHARRTYALSPVKGLNIPYSHPIFTHEDLGLLTKNIQASHDQKIVMRSWGLNDRGKYYGENFIFNEYRHAPNMLAAIIIYIWMSAIQLLPYLTPVRWLVRKMAKPPGDGPILEQTNGYRVEWRGVAEADDDNDVPGKAVIQMTCEKDIYTLTGILLVQTAISILSGDDILARRLGGGILTPSTAASPNFFRNLDRSGFRIQTKIMDQF